MPARPLQHSGETAPETGLGLPLDNVNDVNTPGGILTQAFCKHYTGLWLHEPNLIMFDRAMA